MEIEPGTRLGAYVVERTLGAGRHSTVYQARHSFLGVTRALKVLPSADPELRSRAATEGRILARVEHPHLVRLFDVLDLPEGLTLVLELVPGGSLRSLMDGGPIEAVTLRRLGAGMIAGVAALHRAGVVHRDLNPRNVLIELASDGPRARVADVGLAQPGDDLPREHRTRTNQSFGAPGYRAPEQVERARVDARADVYALGAIVLELLTGFPPGDAAAWSAQLRRDVFELGSFAGYPGVPAGWAPLLDRSLRYAPEARAADAGELIELVPDEGGAVSPIAAAADTPATLRVQVTGRSAPLPVGSAWALVTRPDGAGMVVEVVACLVEGATDAWCPQAHDLSSLEAARAAAQAALAASGASGKVLWQLRAEGVRLEGSSIGLAVAAAVVSAVRGQPWRAGLAFTGAVAVSGAVSRVSGVPAKVRAAAAAGLNEVMLPMDGAPFVEGVRLRPVSELGGLLGRFGG